jgi:hypothetical protein
VKKSKKSRQFNDRIIIGTINRSSQTNLLFFYFGDNDKKEPEHFIIRDAQVFGSSLERPHELFSPQVPKGPDDHHHGNLICTVLIHVRLLLNDYISSPESRLPKNAIELIEPRLQLLFGVRRTVGGEKIISSLETRTSTFELLVYASISRLKRSRWPYVSGDFGKGNRLFHCVFLCHLSAEDLFIFWEYYTR